MRDVLVQIRQVFDHGMLVDQRLQSARRSPAIY